MRIILIFILTSCIGDFALYGQNALKAQPIRVEVLDYFVDSSQVLRHWIQDYKYNEAGQVLSKKSYEVEFDVPVLSQDLTNTYQNGELVSKIEDFYSDSGDIDWQRITENNYLDNCLIKQTLSTGYFFTTTLYDSLTCQPVFQEELIRRENGDYAPYRKTEWEYLNDKVVERRYYYVVYNNPDLTGYQGVYLSRVYFDTLGRKTAEYQFGYDLTDSTVYHYQGNSDSLILRETYRQYPDGWHPLRVSKYKISSDSAVLSTYEFAHDGDTVFWYEFLALSKYNELNLLEYQESKTLTKYFGWEKYEMDLDRNYYRYDCQNRLIEHVDYEYLRGYARRTLYTYNQPCQESLEPQPEEISLSVYPNPATDFVVVESDFREGYASLEVVSIDGKRITPYYHYLGNGIYQVSVSELPAGIYSLIIHQDEQVGSSFFIKV